jgi:hypothetical protein
VLADGSLQPLQERKVWSVANGRASRIRASVEVQPHDSQGSHKVDHGQPACPAELDAAPRGLRTTDATGRLSDAQIEAQARRPDLAPKLDQEVMGDPSSPVIALLVPWQSCHGGSQSYTPTYFGLRRR